MDTKKKTDLFQKERHVFYWFGQILGLRNRVLNQELRPYELDYQRMKVLAALKECPGCSMQRLAEITAVDRTSLTHTVQLLVARGLVDRQASPSDRRVVVLNVTAVGRHMFERIAPIISQLDERTMVGFSAEETRGLLAQLRQMTDNLKNGPSE